LDGLKRAADQGFALAPFNYGVCLHNGEGVSIDFGGAAHYFKLAADQGFALAQFNYGNCLENGKGVSIDFGGAAYYFKRAADQGFAEAQYHLQDSSSLTLDSTETTPVPSIILSYSRQMKAHMVSLLSHRWHKTASELPQISSIHADTMRSIMHSRPLQWFVVLAFSNCQVRAGRFHGLQFEDNQHSREER
jgi:hypothetical protein